MLRRLLQDLQERVESRGGEHMDLIHDVYPLAHIGRGVDRLIPQGADLIHAVVGGSVQLQHIQKTARSLIYAAGTPGTGVAAFRLLAESTALAKILAQVVFPVPRVPRRDRHGTCGPPPPVFAASGDMGLADDIRKCLGPPFAVQGLIHGTPLPHKDKSSVYSCGTGTLAAHVTSRLMLLGSPPDMVHGVPLRETGSAAVCGGLVQ